MRRQEAGRVQREQTRNCSRRAAVPWAGTPRQVRSRRAAAMLLDTQPASRRGDAARYAAGEPMAVSRRRALALLGARGGARIAAVHSAR
eukprot:271125-Prymnesium_polylepis.1